jgi:DNA polymerase epsilon subunit 1
MQQASYVLRDVLCGYCSLGRDLDLLRDPQLQQAAHDARVTGQEAVWRCGHCGNALVREEIENRLLEDVERQLAVYLMQDFRCAKTHAVTARLATALSVLCEPLQMDVAPATMTQRLALLARVAELHRFDFLRDAVAQLLQLSAP